MYIHELATDSNYIRMNSIPPVWYNRDDSLLLWELLIKPVSSNSAAIKVILTQWSCNVEFSLWWRHMWTIQHASICLISLIGTRQLLLNIPTNLHPCHEIWNINKHRKLELMDELQVSAHAFAAMARKPVSISLINKTKRSRGIFLLNPS